jgi:hypothetical protein
MTVVAAAALLMNVTRAWRKNTMAQNHVVVSPSHPGGRNNSGLRNGGTAGRIYLLFDDRKPFRGSPVMVFRNIRPGYDSGMERIRTRPVFPGTHTR